MERTLLNSTIIMNLKEKIQQEDREALQEFWDNVESNGAPLIEEIDGDSENALVTFVYNVGVLEHKQGMMGTNIKLKDVLISKGYDAYFEYFNSGHDYLCWGETLANGLISLIGIN